MEEMHRARYVGRGMELPYSLGELLSPNVHLFTNPVEAL